MHQTSFEPNPGDVTDLAGLADALDRLRRRAALGTGKNRVSLQDLSRSTGLPRSTVHTYVAGKALPAIDVLDRVLIALGATPAELALWSEAWFRVAEARDGRRRESVPTAVAPRQLPPDVPGFTGRHDQLLVLDDLLLRPGRAALVVTGTAGVGKTALVVHWAHRVADRFPDGQLYLNLRGYDVEAPLRPEEALGRLLRTLGVDVRNLPATRDERATSFRTTVADKRFILVLDNARSADQVRDLLPGTGESLVLVTSRDALTGLVARDGARRVDLDVLPLADAVGLLRVLIDERVADQPGAAAELAEACARLPLALRIAGEYVCGRPGVALADAVRELRDERRRLDVLDAGGDERTAVRAVFSHSYHALPAEQARLFRLLGSHPGADFDLHAAAALAGADLATTSALLGGLTGAHMAAAAGPGRYTMHDLLAGYALDLLGHDPETTPSRRLVHYYTYAATRAMNTLYPSDRDRRPRLDLLEGVAVPDLADPAAARAWLDAERANLLGAVRLAENSGWAREVGHLATTLWRDLDVQAHNEDALALQHLAHAAAKAGHDAIAEADALRNLSTAYCTAGHYEASLDFAERCVRLRRDLGDQRGEAAALNSLGIVAGLLGRFGAADEAYQRSLVLRRTTGDKRGEAAVLQNLAVTCLRSRALEYVEEYLTRALTLFREIGDHVGEGHALNNLGDLHHAKQRYAAALDHHERSLVLCREHGLTNAEADALNGIGLDHTAMGHPETAVPLHEQALEAAGQGHHGILTHIHNGFGSTLRALGRAHEARRHHETARELAAMAGDQFEEAVALAGTAETLVPDDPEGARRLWERALAIYRQLGLPDVGQVEARIAAHPPAGPAGT